MKNIVVDTSAIVAVILNEPHRQALVSKAQGANLISPPTLHWEVGNALSALFKKRLLSNERAQQALESYANIPIQFSDVALDSAVALSSELSIYAYDAYMILCARKHNCELMTIDSGLMHAAEKLGVRLVEVKPS